MLASSDIGFNGNRQTNLRQLLDWRKSGSAPAMASKAAVLVCRGYPGGTSLPGWSFPTALKSPRRRLTRLPMAKQKAPALPPVRQPTAGLFHVATIPGNLDVPSCGPAINVYLRAVTATHAIAPDALHA
jgi:hypothetical protein